MLLESHKFPSVCLAQRMNSPVLRGPEISIPRKFSHECGLLQKPSQLAGALAVSADWTALSRTEIKK
jgi:hypothetical protein